MENEEEVGIDSAQFVDELSKDLYAHGIVSQKELNNFRSVVEFVQEDPGLSGLMERRLEAMSMDE